MGDEYQIVIKSSADLKAVNSTEKALQDAIKETKRFNGDTEELEAALKRVDAALNGEAAAAVRAVDAIKGAIASTKALKGETAGLENSLKEAQAKLGKSSDGRGLNGVTQELSRLKQAYNEAGGGAKGLLGSILSVSPKAAVAVSGVVAALDGARRAIMEYASAEAEVAKLDQALAQNGLITDAVREKYQALASAMQNATAIADDEWIGVLKKLTQFGSLPETIERDAEAVKNLAGILEGDLNSAALGISKALQGNFEMFSRWGIEVDEAASQAEKLNKLYEQLAQKGGGQLEAATNTLTGSFRKLQLGFSDLLEAAGRFISSTTIVQQVLYGLGTTASWMAGILGGIIPKAKGVENSLSGVKSSAAEVEIATRKYAEELKHLGDMSGAAMEALNRQLAVEKQLASFQDERTDAQMALDLARIDAKEQQNKLTKEQAIQERSKVRTNAENEKYRRDQEIRQKEVSSVDEQKDLLYSQMGELESAAQEAEGRIAEYEATRQQKLKINQELLKEQKYWDGQIESFMSDRFAFSNDEVGVKNGMAARRPEEAHMSMNSLIRMRLERKYEEAKAKQEAFQGELQSEEKVLGPEVYKNAKEARTKATKEVPELYQKINELEVQRDRLLKEQAHARELQALKNQTTIVEKNSDLAEAQQQREKELSEKASDKGITPAELNELMRLKQRSKKPLRDSQIKIEANNQLGEPYLGPGPFRPKPAEPIIGPSPEDDPTLPNSGMPRELRNIRNIKVPTVPRDSDRRHIEQIEQSKTIASSMDLGPMLQDINLLMTKNLNGLVAGIEQIKREQARMNARINDIQNS